MTEREITRLFPNASAAFIAANVSQVEPDSDNLRMPLLLDAEALFSSYLKTGSVHRTGKEFGVTGDTVHQHLLKAGKKLNMSRWKAAELEVLKVHYADPLGLNLAVLAARIGRTHAAIACKAEEIGLTSARGKHARTQEMRKSNQDAHRDIWDRLPHPRGMTGKKHTQQTRETISKKGIGRPKPPESTLKALKTRVEKYGTAATPRSGCSWKAGWRVVGGQRIYARSRWEANYARYLQLLVDTGEILKWEHEPETFWFEKIKRGCRSYLPDFRVTHHGGSIEYIEVKGWMDARSKTKLRRMKKYHPSVWLTLRDKTWFKQNSSRLRGMISDWEHDGRGPGCLITIREA